MAGNKPLYTPDEVKIAIHKGNMMSSVLTQGQRNYLLGCLLGLFIADGEYEHIDMMVRKVQARVR